MANKYLVPNGYQHGHQHLREEYYGYSHEVTANADGSYNVSTVAHAAEDAVFLAKDTRMLLIRGETESKWYKI